MPIDQAPSGLLADLYELTMAAGYFETHFEARATFELFVRSLPSKRNFLVAAGLEQALEFLETVRFSSDDIAYLRQHPAFARISTRFYDYLATFRFSGDVWALPEGTVCFPGEPLLRISAPIAEAQIMETALLATISFQTMIASKAARIARAAGGRPIVEFGTRRAHGTESGVLAARAAYIGGCLGTSNVRAGQLFDIPTYGTQAHSWIMAHDREEDAFAQFMDIFPNHSVLLLDTYDVRAALEKVIAIGRKPRGVRLDSGDLAGDSIWVRRKLDEVGWGDVEIFMSGDLDEERISALLDAGARVDTFGVGTSLSTSSDAPSLGVLYKLVEIERGGEVREAAKLSAAKVTYPGRKQIYRESNPRGDYVGDVIGLEEERLPGDPLLCPVMLEGKRVSPAAPLAELQKRCQSQIEHLPASVRAQEFSDEAYPVRHSSRLEMLLEEVRERIARTAVRP